MRRERRDHACKAGGVGGEGIGNVDRRAIEDIFRPLGPVIIKRMFGGHGIYAGALMFALEYQGEIYLKTDESSLPIFEAAGLRPFEFESKRGRMVTSYRLLPEDAHEDERELKRWCALAMEAAQRSAAGKTKGTGKRMPKAADDGAGKSLANKSPAKKAAKKSATKSPSKRR